MADGLQALRTYLDDIARRRAALAWRRAWTLGAAVAAVVLLVTAGAIRLASPGPLPLVAAVAAGLAVARRGARRWRCGPPAAGRRRSRSPGWSRSATAGSTTSSSRRWTTPPAPITSRPWPTGSAASAVRAVSALGADVVVDRGGPDPRRPHGAGRRGAAAGGAGPVRAPARRRRRRGVGLPAAVAHRDRRRARSMRACAPGRPSPCGRAFAAPMPCRRRWSPALAADAVAGADDPAGRRQLPRHRRRRHRVVRLPRRGRRPPLGRVLGHRRAPARGRADRARVPLSRRRWSCRRAPRTTAATSTRPRAPRCASPSPPIVR